MYGLVALVMLKSKVCSYLVALGGIKRGNYPKTRSLLQQSAKTQVVSQGSFATASSLLRKYGAVNL